MKIERAANAITVTLGRFSATKFDRGRSVGQWECYLHEYGFAGSLLFRGWHWTCAWRWNRGKRFRSLARWRLPFGNGGVR